MVETLGDQLLAGAAFTHDQDRPVERRGAARALDRVEKRQALPDELICPLHAPTVGGKCHDLARIFGAFALEKSTKCEKSALSRNMARPLYGNQQVKGPDFWNAE